jgi:hypothetical protein
VRIQLQRERQKFEYDALLKAQHEQVPNDVKETKTVLEKLEKLLSCVGS